MFEKCKLKTKYFALILTQKCFFDSREPCVTGLRFLSQNVLKLSAIQKYRFKVDCCNFSLH